ncbi:MAG: hypothetical protein ACJAZ2_001631 [Glaciecola sp.]|jgi:hypothetical protein
MSALSKSNIVSDLSIEKHFYAVVQQLVKDFKENVFEERVNAMSTDQIDELLQEVSLFLSSVCSRSIEEFSQLMYVIDMPEIILRPFLSDGQRGWEEFTYQVIKREYLKVLIRERYST